MKVYSVHDEEFASYGRVWDDVPTRLTEPVVEALANEVPLPEGPDERVYLTTDPVLEALPVADELRQLLFAGTPVELGRVAGRNTRLNALEYHRSSEFNLGSEDFVLLLGHRWDIRDGKLDTDTVKAFRVPAGTLIEVFATTLHFAPCHVDAERGFKVLVALPEHTNDPMTPELERLRAAGEGDAPLLWGVNKWLLAHPECPLAAKGAYVGLEGENVDVSSSL